MNEVDVLKGARKILSNPKRWHKGSFTDGAGAYCVRGALHPRQPSMQMFDVAAVRAQNLLVAHLPSDFIADGEPLAAFNDALSTTHRDILNLLDKVLAELGALA